MTSREIRLESLLHRNVLMPSGKSMGRIEEFEVNAHGEIIVFCLGPAARLRRWLGRLGFGATKPVRISWQQLDLTHPNYPRLKGDNFGKENHK